MEDDDPVGAGGSMKLWKSEEPVRDRLHLRIARSSIDWLFLDDSILEREEPHIESGRATDQITLCFASPQAPHEPCDAIAATAMRAIVRRRALGRRLIKLPVRYRPTCGRFLVQC
jgi:hypothetical protein